MLLLSTITTTVSSENNRIHQLKNSQQQHYAIPSSLPSANNNNTEPTLLEKLGGSKQQQPQGLVSRLYGKVTTLFHSYKVHCLGVLMGMGTAISINHIGNRYFFSDRTTPVPDNNNNDTRTSSQQPPSPTSPSQTTTTDPSQPTATSSANNRTIAPSSSWSLSSLWSEISDYLFASTEESSSSVTDTSKRIPHLIDAKEKLKRILSGPHKKLISGAENNIWNQYKNHITNNITDKTIFETWQERLISLQEDLLDTRCTESFEKLIDIITFLIATRDIVDTATRKPTYATIILTTIKTLDLTSFNTINEQTPYGVIQYIKNKLSQNSTIYTKSIKPWIELLNQFIKHSDVSEQQLKTVLIGDHTAQSSVPLTAQQKEQQKQEQEKRLAHLANNNPSITSLTATTTNTTTTTCASSSSSTSTPATSRAQPQKSAKKKDIKTIDDIIEVLTSIEDTSHSTTEQENQFRSLIILFNIQMINTHNFIPQYTQTDCYQRLQKCINKIIQETIAQLKDEETKHNLTTILNNVQNILNAYHEQSCIKKILTHENLNDETITSIIDSNNNHHDQCNTKCALGIYDQTNSTPNNNTQPNKKTTASQQPPLSIFQATELAQNYLNKPTDESKNIIIIHKQYPACRLVQLSLLKKNVGHIFIQHKKIITTYVKDIINSIMTGKSSEYDDYSAAIFTDEARKLKSECTWTQELIQKVLQAPSNSSLITIIQDHTNSNLKTLDDDATCKVCTTYKERLSTILTPPPQPQVSASSAHTPPSTSKSQKPRVLLSSTIPESSLLKQLQSLLTDDKYPISSDDYETMKKNIKHDNPILPILRNRLYRLYCLAAIITKHKGNDWIFKKYWNDIKDLIIYDPTWDHGIQHDGRQNLRILESQACLSVKKLLKDIKNSVDNEKLLPLLNSQKTKRLCKQAPLGYLPCPKCYPKQ